MRKYRKPYKENVKLQLIVKFIVDLLVVVCISYLLVVMLGERYTIIGNSMNYTLNNEDVVLINKAIYKFTDPKRFDVISFETDGINEGKRYVKRIVGLPGERIKIKDGTVYVNDMVLVNDISARFILTPGLASEEILLGDDEYFVLGDNRNNSEDSRFYTIGNVKRENILGSPWVRIYPLSSFGFVE